MLHILWLIFSSRQVIVNTLIYVCEKSCDISFSSLIFFFLHLLGLHSVQKNSKRVANQGLLIATRGPNSPIFNTKLHYICPLLAHCVLFCRLLGISHTILPQDDILFPTPKGSERKDFLDFQLDKYTLRVECLPEIHVFVRVLFKFFVAMAAKRGLIFSNLIFTNLCWRQNITPLASSFSLKVCLRCR